MSRPGGSAGRPSAASMTTAASTRCRRADKREPRQRLSRSERLLALLQALRRRRRPVSGRVLADELGVSLRTLYRDIATLQGQGAEIEGEPGLGYVLKPGFMLPPLMFSIDELEALVLGGAWVGRQTDDPRLSRAAGNALAK